MDPSPESEVLCEGWMVKSPPLESKPIPGYSLFKARWRRRWFVLQQGKLPRQYLLNYYTDDTKKRLKGTIPLDDCEQVEHGLVDRKGNYDYMFSINTRSRIYFLAVDTREQMDTWVNMVCKACGLRDTAEDEDSASVSGQQQSVSTILVPPTSSMTVAPSVPTSSRSRVYENSPAMPPQPPAPVNGMAAAPSGSNQNKPSISSPYVALSECFSGKPTPPQPPPRQRSIESHRHDSLPDENEEPIYYYMPSTTTIDRNGKPSVLMIPANQWESPALAYIDLDLPATKDDDVFSSQPSRMATLKAQQNESSIIYKTVDLEMTKAFNQTRKDVEEKRFNTTDHRTS